MILIARALLSCHDTWLSHHESWLSSKNSWFSPHKSCFTTWLNSYVLHHDSFLTSKVSQHDSFSARQFLSTTISQHDSPHFHVTRSCYIHVKKVLIRGTKHFCQQGSPSTQLFQLEFVLFWLKHIYWPLPVSSMLNNRLRLFWFHCAW